MVPQPVATRPRLPSLNRLSLVKAISQLRPVGAAGQPYFDRPSLAATNPGRCINDKYVKLNVDCDEDKFIIGVVRGVSSFVCERRSDIVIGRRPAAARMK